MNHYGFGANVLSCERALYLYLDKHHNESMVHTTNICTILPTTYLSLDPTGNERKLISQPTLCIVHHLAHI